jgi:putative ABC transport system permease protein
MLTQTTAITSLNLKSIPERWGPSLVIVIGLAGVVAVFTALLAMAVGFESTLKSTGRTDVALILRGGSDAELNSGLGRDIGTLIKQSPGIRKDDDGQPLASAEMMFIAELAKKGDRTGSNVTVRGIEPKGMKLRPQLKIVEGRMFGSGLRELIVGQGVTRQFDGAKIGQTLRMRGSEWTVVGVFESGDANDSELWCDVEVAMTTFNRQGYSSVRAQLDGPSAMTTLKDALSADPRFAVDVTTELDYYSGQTRQFRQQIGFLAGVVTFIMALGAIFAALNSMYAAVAARSRDSHAARDRLRRHAGGALGDDRIAGARLDRWRDRCGDSLCAVQRLLGVDAGAELHPGRVRLQGDTRAGRSRPDHRRDHRHVRRSAAGDSRGTHAGNDGAQGTIGKAGARGEDRATATHS